MLELAVLGLLSEQPLHGYELKKRLSETLGPLWGISFGSLYPALRRLERSGAIEETEARRAHRRRQRLHRFARRRPRRGPRPAPRRARAGGPARRTASPPEASALFDELLTDETADDERSFALKLSFCRHLDPPGRLAFLERRRVAAHAAARQDAPHPGHPHHRSLHRGRSSSTAPSPPNTTSHGSTS